MKPLDSSQFSASLVEFLAAAQQLKRVPRTGWVDRGIPHEHVESVADHSWGVAMMALVLSLSGSNAGLDNGRVLQLALVHDLAEAITGDDPPYEREDVAALSESDRATMFSHRIIADDLRRKAKREAESHAMQQLTALLPGPAAEALESLWTELSARETPEAQFVKELDRLETYFQSREYALAFPDLAFGSFGAEIQETLTTPMLQELRDAITAATTPDPQD